MAGAGGDAARAASAGTLAAAAAPGADAIVTVPAAAVPAQDMATAAAVGVVWASPGHRTIVLALCAVEDPTAAQHQRLPEDAFRRLSGQCNRHCRHAVSKGRGPWGTHQPGIPQLL